MLKISVITVVRNDERHIEDTIKSVLSQQYESIEYIILDGNSTDQTVSIISKYQHRLAGFISEKDNGIYDAMNKGIRMATGDRIIFVNSGDIFYNDQVVNKAVESLIKGPDADILYGNVAVSLVPFGAYLVSSGTIETIPGHMVMNHQSCFIRTSLHKERPYDLTYRIAADYNFMLSCYLDGMTFKKIDEIICQVSAGGLSDTKRGRTFREMYLIREKLSPGFNNTLRYYKNLCSFYAVSMVKKIMPDKYLKVLFNRKYKGRIIP